MLNVFLTRNVPDDDELLVGWWRVGPSRPPADDLAESGRSRTVVAPLVSRRTPVHDTEDGELDHRAVGRARARDRRAGRRDLPGPRPARGARHHADLRPGRRAGAGARDHPGRLAVRAAAVPAAHAARDRRGDQRDRPLPAHRGRGQRRHHRAHPHRQRDARPPGGGVRRPAPVPRRRGARAATPLTVLPRHLELLDVENPEEVAETRALLLDEVDRMSDWSAT